jgi:hypothetical protein
MITIYAIFANFRRKLAFFLKNQIYDQFYGKNEQYIPTYIV